MSITINKHIIHTSHEAPLLRGDFPSFLSICFLLPSQAAGFTQLHVTLVRATESLPNMGQEWWLAGVYAPTFNTKLDEGETGKKGTLEYNNGARWLMPGVGGNGSNITTYSVMSHKKHVKSGLQASLQVNKPSTKKSDQHLRSRLHGMTENT